MPKMLAKQSGVANPRDRLPEYATERRELLIPVDPPAPAVVHHPARAGEKPGVHINFHGGGFILGQTEADDALCRVIAVEAGVIVLDVDYAVAPQNPFPTPPRQAYEIVQWVAAHAIKQGWDAARITVGGQSAGGALVAAACRQALQNGGPAIRLQVLHYPPLDLTVPTTQKHSPLAKPLLRPWMGEVFDSAYVPDPAQRASPLVSPAAIGDTSELTGIAPAVVIAAGDDILHDEDVRYAHRLAAGGALVELIELPGADHAYDSVDDERSAEMYSRIALHVRAVQEESAADTPDS
jgi:acetyl esterase